MSWFSSTSIFHKNWTKNSANSSRSLSVTLGTEVHPQQRSFMDWLKEAIGG